MKTNVLLIISGMSLSSLFLSSCDTPVGQGAAWGAATGAIIGAAATGNVRAASIGAAAGAAAGALTPRLSRKIKLRNMVRRRPAVILTRAGLDGLGSTTALTPGAFTICAVCRQVHSLAILIRVAFFGGHNYTPVILSKVKR